MAESRGVTLSIRDGGVPDEVVDRVVREIQAVTDRAKLDLVVAVGRIIVERFYGGDLEAWRARGAKDASFQKLAARQDLPRGLGSASALYRATATFELCERTGGVATWKHLTPSHVRAVLGVPPEEQAGMLRAAEEQRWTVRQLEQEVASVRVRTKRSRGGRPPLPGFVKSLRRLERLVGGPDLLLQDVDRVEGLEPGELERLRDVVAALQGRLGALAARLGARAAAQGLAPPP